MIQKQKWQQGIADEVAFWDAFFETKNFGDPTDYNFRLDPTTELQQHIKDLLIGVENPLILDVGAGPLTFLGKNINGVPVCIYPVDALAAYYNIILLKYNIAPPVKTLFQESEELDQLVGIVKPDLIVAQNTLDHSYDPVRAILQMPLVVKPTGVIYLNHYKNTAEHCGHVGLHQWNFDLLNDELIVSSDSCQFNVNYELKSKFSDFNLSIENRYNPDNNQIETIIRRVNINLENF